MSFSSYISPFTTLRASHWSRRSSPIPFTELTSGARIINYDQACKLKFRLRELNSCLYSAAASAVCFEGRVAGLDATETENEFSQLRFWFTSLIMINEDLES